MIEYKPTHFQCETEDEMIKYLANKNHCEPRENLMAEACASGKIKYINKSCTLDTVDMIDGFLWG